MHVTVMQRPRIVVDVIVEIEGIEFDLLDLRELLTSLDRERVQIEEPLSSQLLALGIISFPGNDRDPAKPGPRFDEAKRAVAEALDDVDITVPVE